MKCSIRDFGAVGDGTCNDTASIQAAIDAVSEAGGGTVVFPPGVYSSGTIFLRSGVELHLEGGAELFGSPRKEDYTKRWNAPYDNGCELEFTSGTHLVCAWRQKNIAITGRGTINGNGTAFFDLNAEMHPRHPNWGYRNRWRPAQMVALLECENVRIDGVTLCNSTYWTLWPYACRDVAVTDIRIRNDYRTPNGDGIDPDCCTNVRIENCDIHAGDDCIALRADRAFSGLSLDLENVVITNCILDTPLGGVRFGPSGEKSVLRNITVSNCVIRNGRNGLLFSLWHLGAWDKGCLVENVRISNLIIHGEAPLRMYILEGCGGPECGFRNIHISDVTAFGNDTCSLLGGGDGIFENVSIRDFDLTLTGLEPPIGFPMVKAVSGSAFALRDCREIRLENVRVNSENALLNHLIDAENVDSLTLASCHWKTGTLKNAALHCRNVRNLQVENTVFPGEKTPRGQETPPEGDKPV